MPRIDGTLEAEETLSLQKEEVVDRISDLPDCILCHILSFLPTAYAVATSILSSRWKTLWTFVPCLYLDYSLPMRSRKSSSLDSLLKHSKIKQKKNQSISFPDIVSRVFAQHKAPYLRKFLLHTGNYDAFDVDRWVSPNLEEFDLQHDYVGQIFELPRSIFSCKNLVVLKLRGKILLNLPSSFKLPSLKILLLWITALYDSKLLSCCPVLEDLVLEIFGGLPLKGLEYDELIKLEICVPTLKRLKMQFCIIERDNPNFVLEINAPALEYINFDGGPCEFVFLEKLPNLIEANVSWQSDSPIKVAGLLREFCNVKSLSLSYGTTTCLSLAYDYDLPMFHNLARLNYNYRRCHWHVLQYLLQQAPNLEVLVVNKRCEMEQPPYVLRVLSPHLKTVYFKGFRRLEDLHLTTFYFSGFEGWKDEMKFVKRILKKARVLKKMTFKYWDNLRNAEEEKSRLLKEVSNFPRRSMSCQIAFE